MNNQLTLLFLFIGFCFIIYLLFRNMNFQEGFTSSKSSTTTLKPQGLTENAATYAANIKSQVIKMQDMALSNKYKDDYENAIMNLDDLVNNLMLKTALSVDIADPKEALSQLSSLNSAKSALNNVMIFLDKN